MILDLLMAEQMGLTKILNNDKIFGCWNSGINVSENAAVRLGNMPSKTR